MTGEPLTLSASGRYRGDWVPDVLFQQNDMVNNGDTLYAALDTHISDSTFTQSPHWKVLLTTSNSVSEGYLSANDPFYTGDPSGLAAPTGEQLQAALDDGAQARRRVLARGEVTGWTVDGLNIDIAYTALIGDGLRLNFSEIAAPGQGVHVSGSNTNGAIGTYDQASKGIDGEVEIIGPGRTFAGWLGLLVDGSGPYSTGARALLRGIHIHEAETGMRIGNNTYALGVFDLGINNCGTCFEIPFGLSNSGELIDFYRCLFSNSDLGVSARNSGVDVNLYGCSLDYCKRLVESIAAQVAIIGGHMEAGTSSSGTSDADFMFYCGQDSATLTVEPATMVIASSRAVYPIGYCQGSEGANVGGGFGHTGGGVAMGGIHFDPGRMDIGRSGRTYDLSALILGGGRVTTGPRMKHYISGKFIPVSLNLNSHPTGAFQSVSAGLHGFILPTLPGASPFIDTAHAGRDGTGNSLRMRTPVAQTNIAISNNAPTIGAATIAIPGITAGTSLGNAQWASAAALQTAIRALDASLSTMLVNYASGIFTLLWKGAASAAITGDVTIPANTLKTAGGSNITLTPTTVAATTGQGLLCQLQERVYVQPGQALAFDWWMDINGITGNTLPFSLRVEWRDSNDVGNGHTDFGAVTVDSVGVDTNGYQHYQPMIPQPAPPGTVSAIISWRCSNSDGTIPWDADFGAFAQLEDLVVNVI